jgi:lysophospholipase L1-like esterase
MIRGFVTCCVVFCVAEACIPLRAAPIVLGVMGDSLSDEYSEASYGAYAQNWVQQLAIYNLANLGPTAAAAGQPGGTWGEPRRRGYEYNWARAGASSGSLLSGGQHTGVAGQVPTKSITHAVLAIGANDFAPGGQGSAYYEIYNGNWPTETINNYVNQRVANVTTALNTVLPTGVKLALVNFPDYSVAPVTQALFNEPAKRDRVTAVIAQVNAALDSLTQAKQIPRIDLFGVAQTLFGTSAAPKTTLLLGNVTINLAQTDTSGGSNPTAGFVHDGVHPNTTLQGLLANLFMRALDMGYDAGVPMFSEQEILAHRGIAYGGSDTLVAQIGNLRDYIANYAPPLANAGDVNNDAMVDIFDVNFVSAHWAETGPDGDSNHDGLVDIFDVNQISANWTAGDGATAVPEPSGIALYIAALVLLSAARASNMVKWKRRAGG